MGELTFLPGQDGRLDEAAITIATENEHRRLRFPGTPAGLGVADT
jgi:hypothetical protein